MHPDSKNRGTRRLGLQIGGKTNIWNLTRTCADNGLDQDDLGKKAILAGPFGED